MDAGRTRVVALVLSLATCWNAGAAEPAELLESFARRTIVLSPPDAPCIVIDAWLAETPEQMRQGLMFIRTLESDEGMLFNYDPPRRASMWMKNTYVSLDMVFVKADDTVLEVARDTKPRSLRSIRASRRVGWVLELKAGSAASWGIVPGTKMTVHEGVIAKLAARARCSDL